MTSTLSILNPFVEEQVTDTESKKKFGTLYGVFVPNVTMMLGVILFLRLGTIVGHVGLLQFGLIVMASLALMITTSFSIAMIATNMEVGSGGVYYLISRSLGLEIGGAIGLALCMSQLFCLTLCTSAFAYSLTFLFPEIPIETVKIVTLVCLTAVSMISSNLVLKTQVGILFILLLSVFAVFFGSSANLPAIDSTPSLFPNGMGFWHAFAMFYPAMTGIEAGMAMSGNLRNPSKSLALGNLYSLLLVGGIYFILGTFIYFSVPQKYLTNMPLFMIDFAPIAWLTYLGIWCAAIASSLGCLLGGPRMLQSLADDGVVPKIFGKGYGAHNEPRWGVALIFAVSLLLMLFTTIDQIIPMLTMICLISYGILNFVAAIAQLIDSPSWRPRFRVPWYIPMAGALGAFALMLMIDAGWTFIALTAVLVIYLLLRSRDLRVSFPDLRESILYFFSRMAIYRLTPKIEHPLNWHPQILACTLSPNQQMDMVHFASSLTRRSGILTVAAILPEKWEDPFYLQRTKSSIQDYLTKQKILSLVEVCPAKNLYDGVTELTRSYGIGPLQPNTLLMGLPSRSESLNGLISILRTAYLCKKNVILFTGDNSQENPFPLKRPKVIDVWWDSENSESFELMLSFIDTLTSGSTYRGATIQLKIAVSDHSASSHVREYFEGFIRKSRMKMTPQIIMPLDKGNISNHFGNYSHDADLIFFPLLPIGRWPASEESAAVEYLSSLALSLPQNKACAFISCYDALKHREIYVENM